LFFENRAFLRDNVEKHCRAGEPTDDNITRRMRIACWVPKVTYTHSEYVLLCHWNIGCTNAPQC